MLTHAHAAWPRPCFTSATTNLLYLVAPGVRAEIETSLETQTVTRDTILFEASDAGEYIYFPQGPLISIEQNRVEVALVGSEGMVGWPALAGCRSSPYRAIVRGRDGTVLRIRTEALLAIAGVVPALGTCLNRFVNVIGVQMAETICAYASHRVDVRLVRWLLLRHDRVGGDELLVHHEEIAANLGTRRASITDCLHIIEGAGLVRCRRGKIVVRDRAGMQALVVDCYGAAEALYRDEIGSFGKGAGTIAGAAAPSGDKRQDEQRERAAPTERPSFLLRTEPPA
ncbi:Crp/Fnr family transcriptional regulator [Sphingomonas sp. BN140010]|uniref:Crp/Fnr family transcriptional regulator n=1 Tax=Sphingomonas arvum TaxID=2992113 RepID=A0ABT3JCU9_9SPHN|nr:Crp/Fnr family transcriptional regulator [Sphingomonas sp. BN140010]MCW3796893.1 Crp/Fnr family transcriptional regulator [Sphingomonas sp. BN140010]